MAEGAEFSPASQPRQRSKTEPKQHPSTSTSTSTAAPVTQLVNPDLVALRKALPAEVFRPSTARSIAYVVWDFAVIAALFWAMTAFNASSMGAGLLWYPVFALYTLATGTMFWAVFVLGHDCGHGSFSTSADINSVFGHLTHSFILVPFHSWRITHRKHHKNTGNIDKDEIFHPVRDERYNKAKLPYLAHEVMLPYLAFLAWPVYLLFGYRGSFSHFDPSSKAFADHEKPMVRRSLYCWSVMAALLGVVGCVQGFGWLALYYGAPYYVFATWLYVVTFLHHHEEGIAWFSGNQWSYVKGNMSTVDRTYGLVEPIHHNIGTHTIHHLFPLIPHYRLLEADAAFRAAAPKFDDEDVYHRRSTASNAYEFVTGWARYLRRRRIGNDVPYLKMEN